MPQRSCLHHHSLRRLLSLPLCIWPRLCKAVGDYFNLSKEERRASKHIGLVTGLPPPKAIASDAACLAARASDTAHRLLDEELRTLRPSKVRSVLLGFCGDATPSPALVPLLPLVCIGQVLKAGSLHLDALPPPSALSFGPRHGAVMCPDMLRRVLQVLGMQLATRVFETAAATAVLSLHAVRLSRGVMNGFPRVAAHPTAVAFGRLLPLIPYTSVSMHVFPGCAAQLWRHKIWQSALMHTDAKPLAAGFAREYVLHAPARLHTHQIKALTQATLCFLQQKDKTLLEALSDTASLLTEVAGILTRKQAAQLEAAAIAAADTALTYTGDAEAAEQNAPPGFNAAQPLVTSEGQRRQQAAAEASAPQRRQAASLSSAISYVGCSFASALYMNAVMERIHFNRHCCDP